MNFFISKAAFFFTLLQCLTLCISKSVYSSDDKLSDSIRSVWSPGNGHFPVNNDDYDLVNVRVVSKRSDPGDDSMRIHLNVFGKDMNLNLKPNTDFSDRIKDMKVFLASTQSNGEVKYSEDHNIAESPEFGKPYHDSTNMAAVIVSHDPEGRLQMDGTLGNDLVIKPMPSSVSEVLDEYYQDHRDDDEMFLDNDGDSNGSRNSMMTSKPFRNSDMKSNLNKTMQNTSENNRSSNSFVKYSTHYKIPKLTGLNNQKSLNDHKNTHIVYKKARHSPEHHSDYLELEPGISLLAASKKPDMNRDNIFNSSTSYSTSREPSSSSSSPSSFSSSNRSSSPLAKLKRSRRQAPDTVWPEVLLVVDYDSYILHGGNSRDVKRYFISFWNGVDLRYKLLSHPTIRVSLAGMIVAKDRDATPYLERNRLRPPNADAVDAAGALTDMGKYLYREDRLPTYDLAVVITKLDMCRRRYEGGRCNRGTAGFAYVGGACVVNKRLEKVNSVAIIEDSGGFSGIIVAAHEVGHLLGCVHDGSPPPSYLGGPGATRCPWEDGFIMSDLRHTERGFRWSSCSVEQFKHFLNGETATCLYNYPHENQLLPRVLPGTMLTLDEQCKRDRGTNACFKDARVCAQLFCFDSASGYCVSYRPAAEGSPCGDGQVCRNGKCTAELENIIPDYTHVTQTISRSPIAGSETNGPSITRRSSQSRFRNRQGVLRSTTEYNSQQPTPSSPKSSMENQSNDECRDNVAKIGGSMSCSQFLEKYSYRYCNHNYVKRHCCASHSVMCSAE